jgi:aryl-alcohol dehydrogenase-like predicted oxidoreductase
VAKKYHVGIVNVAAKYILDKPAVAGVIIGARLGMSEHRSENAMVFSLNLDKEDNEKIMSVISKSNDLFSLIGDCGSEYH